MKNEQKFHLNRLAGMLVTPERFGRGCPEFDPMCPFPNEAPGSGFHAHCRAKQRSHMTLRTLLLFDEMDSSFFSSPENLLILNRLVASPEWTGMSSEQLAAWLRMAYTPPVETPTRWQKFKRALTTWLEELGKLSSNGHVFL